MGSSTTRRPEIETAPSPPALSLDSPSSPCLSGFNTENTEDLSELCVEALLSTEDAEKVRTARKIFAAREEYENSWHRIAP
jgi:hypothetical protein